MIPSLQKFGDKSWTQDKLDRVRKYLVAYSKILSKKPFHYAYIDGFAGTGYHELEVEENDGESLFPEADEPPVAAFLDGSARDSAASRTPVPRIYLHREKPEEDVGTGKASGRLS